ncbi:MAG: carbohydrate ABC transporter permease [Conexivisphaerales archaeon]
MAFSLRVNPHIKEKIILIIVLLVTFIIFFPIYWIIIGSFKSTVDFISPTPKFVFTPTMDNYKLAIERTLILPAMRNSLIVGLSNMFLGLLIGVPAAYIFSRFNFTHKNNLKFWILSLRFMPPIAVVIPFYDMWIGIGLYDTYMALIITYLLISLPLIIWLMSDYFAGIPKDIEEAAMVDGCSLFQTFYKISLPIAIPGIISVGLFAFVLLWNEFFIAFVLTTKNITLPVAVAASSKFGMEIPWGQLCAEIVILIIPSLIFASLFRKVVKSLVIK